MTVLNLDCRHGLAMLPDNSVDAILTDPPYELGFMGHAWDKSGIAYDVAMWREALRVLKPGGHMLAFSGSRTYHRMACAIEDADFAIRDQMLWVYGSGFPKSLDISKALAALSVEDYPEWIECQADRDQLLAEWEGWGTALKPAHEPICVARKPLAGRTVAANILAHGVGGLNIDACRVPIDLRADASQLRTMAVSQHDGADGWGMNTTSSNPAARVLGEEGRWPANLIHDGSPEVLAMFPDARGSNGAEPRADGGGSAARFFQRCEWGQGDLDAALLYYCAKASKREKNAGLEDAPDKILARSCQAQADAARGITVDQGSGAFNRARVVKNNHPTVKPVALGRYLSRLICPPGGTILDLFAGSGSLPLSAKLEGFNALAFEMCPESTDLANRRIAACR